MVNVLIVDDSSFIRRSLTALIEKDPELKVIGTAGNGEDAIKQVQALDPDVVTLDIEMPRMDGLTALQRIMAENPCPVMMVSSLTQEGADVTLKALDYGALDYIPKLSSASLPDLEHFGKDLCAKLRALARRKAFLRLQHKNRMTREMLEKRLAAGRRTNKPSSGMPSAGGLESHIHAAMPHKVVLPAKPSRLLFDVVVIGVSTGGPPAVQKVLTALPAEFPAPILIAQHMPASFTGPFASRLNTQCKIAVTEAQGIERLKPGTAYIAPGGKHLRVEGRPGALNAVVTEEPKEALYKPSATVLMETAGHILGARALGIMLTGMGSDGLEGARVLKAKGGKLLAQNEASCVVYGMPKAVVDAGLADEIVDIDTMAAMILAHFPE